MKQLLILSGKGGTGKTTLTSLLIPLLNAKKYADCDVDAPNLHLSLPQEIAPKKQNLFGMKKAFIHSDICINCGKCMNFCRFDAISIKNNQHRVNPILCEGCNVCNFVCPVNAIEMLDNVNGILENYETDNSFFTTASLTTGSGNTGFLVSEVKNQLTETSIQSEIEIIDGSPGIGCPVIASLTGVDLALIVTEPSISGFEDMKRVLETANRMNIPTKVCINKADINNKKSLEIEQFCKDNEIPFFGKIPFDQELSKIANGEKMTSHSSEGYKEIERLANRLKTELEE